MSLNEPQISVLLVDDHPAVRQGLGLLLATEGIRVFAEADRRTKALECLAERQPDLALVDLSLGGEEGVDLISDLCALNLPVLVYSMHEDIRHIESAFAAGALGYVTKRELHGVLVQAIREVAQEHRFISPNVEVIMADYAIELQSHGGKSELSDQERQVYRLLGEGEGTIEIATAMGISTRTVESYYARIIEKLDIECMRDLRRHAIYHFHNHTS